MKIVDKTPYRSEAGEIDIMGRIQGTLKYGLTWYNRIQAQDTVIEIIGKQLAAGYTLLRNITLPGTEINLPLVLVGPPGVFLINVTHEHGVYQAKDDEWGTMVGDRFVPAGINQIGRTSTFGRVLQRYLDIQGFKGMLVVESILMAADPGMHIESTRPAVRIVMSDALERFAASLAQGRVLLNAPVINSIVQAILVGRQQKPAPEPGSAPSPSSSAPAETETSSFETYTPGQSESQSGAFSSDPLAYSFDNQQPAEQPPAVSTQKSAPSAESAPAPSVHPKPASRPAARKRSKGITRNQWIILAVMIFFWLCLMAGAIIYYFTNA
jgi:hypothetical protein